MSDKLNATDLAHLRRCVELAAEAVAAGDYPFGSVLADGGGSALAEDRNRENSTGDFSSHPEFTLARWAAANLDPQQRATATVYTSGEHCPMCAAAHGWAGLGRIVYVSSSEQSRRWREELGVPAAVVRPLPISEIVPGITVIGPVPELVDEIHELHRRLGAPD